MKVLLLFLILLVLGYGTLTASAQATTEKPSRIHISYSVKTGIGHGELNEVIDIDRKNENHTFIITSNAQATGVFKVIKPGSILRKSSGHVTDKGLQPEYYSDQRADNEPSLALFDWKNQVITLKHEGQETRQPLVTGTMDRLSLSYNFIFTPLDSIQTGKILDFHVTDGRSLQLMQFEVSHENLDTPLGKLETIVLTKLFSPDDKMQRKIWLAPAYLMIPVRIQSIENDGLEVVKMVDNISLDYVNDGICCAQ